MPVYHSKFNSTQGQQTCGTVVLPLKTKVKGPAPPANGEDIIDEAISFFRANVLFRTFESKGPADLTLCYLTAFIGELLRHFQKNKTKADAKKNITSVSMSQTFALPGEAKFCLNGFFKNPATKAESDLIRQYFRQLREETVNRMLDIAYDQDGNPNKWWMSFSKKKFMNITDAT